MHFKRNLAFTLIELLVVISIIALLISLLLPALRSAKEAANVARCASIARQMMIANDIYAEDNDDHYTSNTWYGNGQVTINGVSRPKYWMIDKEYLRNLGFSYQQLSNILEGGDNNERWGAQWPEEFMCPSWVEVENIYNHKLSYGFNSQRLIIEGYKRDAITDPTTKYAYAEQQNWLVNAGMANYNDWDVWGEEWSGGSYSGLKYRHNEGANFAFFGGHVSYLKKEDAYSMIDNNWNLDRWDPYR